MTPERKHDFQVDNLRAFAILTVLIGHSFILYNDIWRIYPVPTIAFLNYMKRIMDLYQMPLFFSISGYLLAKSTSGDNLIRFAAKKARRILLPFLLIGLCWVIPIRILMQYPFYDTSTYFGAAYMLLDGTDIAHLWFLPTTFCFFMIAYGAKRLFGNRLGTWIAATVVGVIAYPFTDKLPHNSTLTVYLRYFTQFFWSFPLGAALFWLKKDHRDWIEQKKARLPIKCGAVILSLAAAFAAVFVEERLTLPASVLLVIVLYGLVPDKQYPVAGALSKNSYGLYLLHSPLLYITYRYALHYPPAVVISINFLVWGSVAYLLTIALRKTPLKFVIGE